MYTHRPALAFLVVTTLLATLIAANPAQDTIEALRKAQTKADRIAVLKGKDGVSLEEVLLTIFNLQGVLVEKGEFGELQRTQVWAEEVTELVPDAERREICTMLCRLGKGRNEQAQERYKEAVDVYTKLLGDVRKKGQFKPLEPALLNNLGTVQYHQGDFVGGLKTLKEARSLLAGLDVNTRAVMEAMIIGNIGELYSTLGDYPEAETVLKQALQRAQKSGDAKTIREVRVNLANLDQHRGRLRESIKAYEAVLADTMKAGQNPASGRILNNLGLALAESGRSGEALRRLEEARKLAVDLRHRRSQALALGNLALVHTRLNDDEEAARYNAEALKLFEAVGDNAGIARCLKMIGMMDLSAGRIDDAEKAFARCLEMTKQSGSKSAVAEMTFLIGMQYFQDRNWQQAEKTFEAALRAHQELGDGRRILICRHLRLWVMAVTNDNRYDAEYLNFVLDTKRYDDPRAIIHTQYFQALGHLLQQQWRPAEEVALAAIRELETRRALSIDPQIRAAEVSSSKFSDFYVILAAARTGRGDQPGAFQAVERAKARALMELLGGENVIQRGMTASERADEELLRTAVVAASRKYESIRQFAGDSPMQREEIKKELTEAEAKYEGFRRRLFIDHPDLSILRAELPDVSLVDLQKSLFSKEPDLAILSYLVNFDRILIVVVTAADQPDAPAKVVIHGVAAKEKELAEAASEFSKSCQNPGGGRPKSDTLWTWLIAPAMMELAGKKHLVIVPFSPLLTLPFQALTPDTDRKTPYLIEQFAVSYAPSVSALLQMRTRGDKVRTPNDPQRTPIVAVGGVNFTPDLRELKHSGPEAEAIGKLFGQSSRVLLGAKATRAEILRAAPSTRILHFATHGIPNGLRPLFSAVAVTPQNDDGRLYGHDVTNLDLSTELVVLSACETAKGRELRGEGTIGLAWAFFVAGVPTVMMTQWSVDDEATAVLMKVFYERLRTGTDTSRAESLRQAQLTLLKEKHTRHPMFWAPFVLTGDWR